MATDQVPTQVEVWKVEEIFQEDELLKDEPQSQVSATEDNADNGQDG